MKNIPILGPYSDPQGTRTMVFTRAYIGLTWNPHAPMQGQVRLLWITRCRDAIDCRLASALGLQEMLLDKDSGESAPRNYSLQNEAACSRLGSFLGSLHPVTGPCRDTKADFCINGGPCWRLTPAPRFGWSIWWNVSQFKFVLCAVLLPWSPPRYCIWEHSPMSLQDAKLQFKVSFPGHLTRAVHLWVRAQNTCCATVSQCYPG